MARIFITGSTDGLGLAAAQSLLDKGHHLVVHARSPERLGAVQGLMERGAAGVVGDLSDMEQVRGLAGQVKRSGPVDVVIHNAGVFSGPHIFMVNVVAPYLLTALMHRPPADLSQQRHAPRGPGRTCRQPREWPGPERLLLGQQALPDRPGGSRSPVVA